MQTYVLEFIQRFNDENEETLLWECQAEDEAHAEEQLLDAEEGVVSVRTLRVMEAA